MISKLIWVDYGIIGVLCLSMLISVVRGFVRECLSLIVWIVAVAVALLFSDSTAVFLTSYVTVPSVRLILAFAGLFLITLVLGGLVNYLVGTLVEKTGLSGTDRVIGIVFGLLRGIAVVTVLVLLAGLTPLPADPWWSQSILMPRFVDLASLVIDWMPAPYAEHFSFEGPAAGEAVTGNE
jgi:membrane protein required for colicin V production